MGGTFDPIHYGHLVAAEMARTEFALNQVLFVPTGLSPHKKQRRMTDAQIRYHMVEMAIRDNPQFIISSIELERRGPSYTVDTLKELQQIYLQHELFFITGTDALREIFDWHKAEEILTLTRFIAATRPGYGAQEFLTKMALEYPQFMKKIHVLEVPALAISSTDIRSRLAKGQPIRYLLPDEVYNYIQATSPYPSYSQ
jgi:nicotinate-nucleotide adenylyltransferase